MKSIKYKLIVANIIIVLFSVINTSAPNFIMEVSSLGKNIAKDADSKVESIWTNINLFLQKPIDYVKNATTYVKTHSITKNQTEDYFEEMLVGENNFSSLYYTNEIPYCKEGGFFYTSTHLDHAADYDQTQRGWYKQSIGKNGITITDPYADSTTNELVATVAHDVVINNKGKGVVGIDIVLSDLTKMISEIKLTESGQSFLLDKYGRYITHDDKNKILNTNFFSDYKDFYQYKDQISIDKTLIETRAKNRLYFSARTISEESGWVFVTIGPIKELLGGVITDLVLIIVVSIFSILIACVISIFLATQIVKPIKVVDAAINEIANGNADLTQHIEIKSKDEIGSLVNGFNNFMEKLHSIVGQIKDSKDALNNVENNLQQSINNTSVTTGEIVSNIGNVNSQVAEQSAAVQQTSTTVAEIAENINSLEKMIENQSSGITEASAAVEEMIGNISSVNNSVMKMAELFEKLEKDAGVGTERQKNVAERIAEVADLSKALQDANLAIANVANQTNLLAMNAAIEAAHAGESGKGFSVVADEIRKLSETSTQESKKIGTELNEIESAINLIVDASKASSESFDEVCKMIRETDGLVRQIRFAMEEQQEGSKQIVEALKMMNDNTVEVQAASREMTEENSVILETINHLQETTEEIKNSVDKMTSCAREMEVSESELNELSVKVEESVTQIGKEIDEFQT